MEDGDKILEQKDSENSCGLSTRLTTTHDNNVFFHPEPLASVCGGGGVVVFGG